MLRIRRGYRIVEGAVEILCLAPFPGAAAGPNEDSLVLRVAFGERALLLTGDIGLRTERQLMAAALPPGDLLKVAHHGAEDGSGAGFLEILRPRVAAVSAGSGNRFGHPAATTLMRIRASRASLLRTDHDGAVRLATDGRVLYAGSMKPGHPLPFPGPALRSLSGPRRDFDERKRHEAENEDHERQDSEPDAKRTRRDRRVLDGRVGPSPEDDEDDGP